MPLTNVRYRVKKMKGGKKVRLAFRKGSSRVVEAKNLGTGATKTPADFARDRKRKGGGRLKAMMMAGGR